MKLTDNYTGPGGQWLDRHWKKLAIGLAMALVLEAWAAILLKL